jgi:hypothetical protein
MSGQYSEEKSFETSDNGKESDSDINDPAVNPTGFSDDVPMDDGLTGETISHDQVPLGDTKIPYVTPPLVEKSTTEESMVSRSVYYNARMDEAMSHETPVNTTTAVPTALLDHEESERFRARWNEIQGKFVDEPRSAVQEADALVSEVVEKITTMFTTEHSALESQWNAGDVVSTEDLRKALQHYRSFFKRLVV